MSRGAVSKLARRYVERELPAGRTSFDEWLRAQFASKAEQARAETIDEARIFLHPDPVAEHVANCVKNGRKAATYETRII